MQPFVNQRFKKLKFFLKNERKMTVSEIAEAFMMTPPSLGQITEGDTSPKIDKIIYASKHPKLNDVNWLWLIFGEGEMLNKEDNEKVAEPLADYGQVNILMKQIQYMQEEIERLRGLLKAAEEKEPE